MHGIDVITFFFVLEYKSWQVCVWGKDSAFCLFSLLFNALSVVGDIVRDSLLQNNDVDSFAQKYLRWKSQQCKNDLPPIFYVGNTLNINLLWCTAIKQGTVRNADVLSFFLPPHVKLWERNRRGNNGVLEEKTSML